jgi:hypothetical protein
MGAQITGGVDTHRDVHVAAALDEHGGLLGTASFATTPEGYYALAEWLRSFGAVTLVGVEGDRELRRGPDPSPPGGRVGGR